MNKVILIGNLSKDIEIRFLQSGVAVGNSSIAINNSYKTQDGQVQNDVCFLDFQMFGRTSEICNQYLKKGSKVAIEGKLIQQSWQDSQGNKKSKYLVNLEKIEFLDSKNANNNVDLEKVDLEKVDLENPNATQKPKSEIETLIQNNFSISPESDKIVIHFLGSESEYKIAQQKWSEIYAYFKKQYPNKSFEIKKDIIDNNNDNQIPF